MDSAHRVILILISSVDKPSPKLQRHQAGSGLCDTTTPPQLKLRAQGPREGYLLFIKTYRIHELPLLKRTKSEQIGGVPGSPSLDAQARGA
jgi:hypothetical protein